MQHSSDFAGRRGLIVGVANPRSLAHGIAQRAAAHGARLVLTYQGGRVQRQVTELGAALATPAAAVLPWEAGDDAQLEALAAAIAARWGALDFLVHAVAAAPRAALEGRFGDTTRAAFASTMDVSVYSLLALCRALRPLLAAGVAPAVLTLTYRASQQAVPNYNVMGVAKAALEASVRYLAADLGPEGIRVNALSAGPVRTLSAASITGLRPMLAHVASHAPLRRNVDAAEVGDAALFALGTLGRGMTGEVFHVDAGMHCVGQVPAGADTGAAPGPGAAGTHAAGSAVPAAGGVR